MGRAQGSQNLASATVAGRMAPQRFTLNTGEAPNLDLNNEVLNIDDVGSPAHIARLEAYARARSGKYVTVQAQSEDQGRGYTDMRGLVVINNDLGKEFNDPRVTALCMNGQLRHEMCHVDYSDPVVFAEFAKELERIGREVGMVTSMQLKDLWNELEDGMIEERERTINPLSYQYLSARIQFDPKVGGIRAVKKDMTAPYPGYVPEDAAGKKLKVQEARDENGNPILDENGKPMKVVMVPAGTKLSAWGKKPLSLVAQADAAVFAAALPEYQVGELHPDVRKALDECLEHIDAAVHGNTADCVARALKIYEILQAHGLTYPETLDPDTQEHLKQQYQQVMQAMMQQPTAPQMLRDPGQGDGQGQSNPMPQGQMPQMGMSMPSLMPPQQGGGQQGQQQGGGQQGQQQGGGQQGQQGQQQGGGQQGQQQGGGQDGQGSSGQHQHNQQGDGGQGMPGEKCPVCGVVHSGNHTHGSGDQGQPEGAAGSQGGGKQGSEGQNGGADGQNQNSQQGGNGAEGQGGGGQQGQESGQGGGGQQGQESGQGGGGQQGGDKQNGQKKDGSGGEQPGDSQNDEQNGQGGQNDSDKQSTQGQGQGGGKQQGQSSSNQGGNGSNQSQGGELQSGGDGGSGHPGSDGDSSANMPSNTPGNGIAPGGFEGTGGYNPGRRAALAGGQRERNDAEGRGHADSGTVQQLLSKEEHDLKADKVSTAQQAHQTATQGIRKGRIEANNWKLPPGHVAMTQKELERAEMAHGRGGTAENKGSHSTGTKLAKRLQNIMAENRSPTRDNLRGRRVAPNKLGSAMSGRRDVMERPGIRQAQKIRITNVNDRSGSVFSDPANNKGMGYMAKAFGHMQDASNGEIQVGVYGYDGGGFGTGRVGHFAYKEYHSKSLKGIDSLINTGGGGTPTADGIEFGIARVMAARKTHPNEKFADIMPVVTDGAANDNQAAAAQCARARSLGISVFGLAFHCRASDMDEIFGPGNWAAIDSYPQAADIVARMIEKVYKATNNKRGR